MFGWLPSKAEDEKRKRNAYLEAIGEKNQTSQLEETHYSSAPLRSGTAIIPRFAAMKTKSPWMDGAQSRPELQPSDAEIKPDVAERDTQQYSNPLKPPEWLAHDHLEPPGLPSTPPPPPPAYSPLALSRSHLVHFDQLDASQRQSALQQQQRQFLQSLRRPFVDSHDSNDSVDLNDSTGNVSAILMPDPANAQQLADDAPEKIVR